MAIFGSQFYHQSLRKYIVMFGNMFNDMVVQRLDASTNVVQTIVVPIMYSAQESFLARLTADPSLNRPVAIQLPAASFQMTDLQYDPTRRLPGGTKNVATLSSDVNKLRNQLTPVPWNMQFSLYLYVKSADDGAQLLEQILPFFGPEWTNSVNLIPAMGIKMDVPTILNNVSIQDSFENEFLTRRALIYTLDFTSKGYFFGPVRTSGIIKRVQVDIGAVYANTGYDTLRGIESTVITAEDVARTGRSSRIVVTPGLTANGTSTTDSALSVNYTLISANSNYGIASNTFFFQDGKKYDPVTDQDS